MPLIQLFLNGTETLYLKNKIMNYEDLEEGDLVYYQDPNRDFKTIKCRVIRIYDKDGIIDVDTEVTLFDEFDNAYYAYACELSYDK